MTTITKEHAQKIIDAADEVITALAGTNDDFHPDNSEKMCGLWDDLNDRYAPPEVVRELARAMLASMDAEPAGYHVIKECGKVGCSVATLEEAEKTRDFWNKKWIIRPYFYTAQPVQETGVYKDMLNIVNLLENNEWAEHCTSTVLGSLLESEITRLVGKEQPAPVVPVGLRMALSNAGIAAPESDEMLAATHEKYIQALVTWVKDRKPFQPAQVVLEEVMPGGLVYSTAQPEFENKDSDKVVGYYCFISGKTQVVESQEQAYADAKSVINACRATMLQGEFRDGGYRTKTGGK
ncbi:TPA: hypothetical protein ACGADT_003487 [Salmonella enterica subsp. enterica serovar Newport]